MAVAGERESLAIAGECLRRGGGIGEGDEDAVIDTRPGDADGESGGGLLDSLESQRGRFF